MTTPASAPPEGTMSMDEIALRAAINVLRDTLESRRMPSGLALESDAHELHERAVRRLEEMLHQVQGGEPS